FFNCRTQRTFFQRSLFVENRNDETGIEKIHQNRENRDYSPSVQPKVFASALVKPNDGAQKNPADNGAHEPTFQFIKKESFSGCFVETVFFLDNKSTVITERRTENIAGYHYYSEEN